MIQMIQNHLKEILMTQLKMLENFSAATDKAKTIVVKSKDSIVNVVDAMEMEKSTLKILLLLVLQTPH